MPLMALPDDDASQPIPVFEWDVVNESAGGLKVRRMGATQPAHRRGRGRRREVHAAARAGRSASCAGSRASTRAAWSSASSSSARLARPSGCSPPSPRRRRRSRACCSPTRRLGRGRLAAHAAQHVRGPARVRGQRGRRRERRARHEPDREDRRASSSSTSRLPEARAASRPRCPWGSSCPSAAVSSAPKRTTSHET